MTPTESVAAVPPAPQYTLEASPFDLNAAPEPAPAPPAPPAAPPVAAPVPPPTPPAESHSPRLLALAREVGLDQAEIDATPVGKLKDVLAEIALERQLLAKPAPAATAPEVKTGFEAIDPEAIAPEIYQVLKEQQERLQSLSKRDEEYQQALKILLDNEKRRQTETEASAADQFFLQHPEIYGKETFRDLEKDKRNPSYVKRATVETLAKQLKVDRATAHSMLYGSAPATPPAPAPAPTKPPQDPATGKFVPRYTAEEWAAASAAVPTQRGGAPEMPGDEKAMKAVAAVLAARSGIEATVVNNGSVGLDDFLG